MRLNIRIHHFINILLILISLSPAYAQKQDFGSAGLKELSAAQLAALANGEIVFLKEDHSKESGSGSLTEAVMVFSTSPEKTWKLISNTSDQPKYIAQCKEVKVRKQLPGKAHEIHCVGNWMVTYKYGVVQNYLPQSNCLYWTLDTSYPKNDLISLNGYWQLYPYSKDKTLARYGSSVSFKSVPEFVENMFKKGGVRDALTSVKKYVDSGGTYRK